MLHASDTSASARLGELLASNKELLLDRWTRRVTLEHVVPGELPEPALRDHIPNLLDELIGSLRGLPGSVVTACVEHADERARQDIPLRAALRELGLLRTLLIELCDERQFLLEGPAAQILHAKLDAALTDCALHATDRLREDVEFRERFMGVLSHDLRNPISAIKLGTSMLMRPNQSADARQRTVERIASSAKRMLRMLEDLLDFTRLRQGDALPINPRPVELEELCKSVVREHEATHTQHRFVLESSGLVHGTFDPDRLAQALANVVESAIDHSPPETEIRVELATGERTSIRVSNRGPHIPADELATVFDPFRRGKAAKAGERASRGLGLGLFIAERIVRAHGGSIVAESDPSGTSFTITLPG